MDLVKLFSDSSPCVLGFINKLSTGPTRPLFPEIFGTGFFVDASGLAATNGHVIEIFSQLRPHPKTGESALAAVSFFSRGRRISGCATARIFASIAGFYVMARRRLAVKALTGEEKAAAVKGAATKVTSLNSTPFAQVHPPTPSALFPFWNGPRNVPCLTRATDRRSRGAVVLIANLELEFHATARKQGFGAIPNRKYFAILQVTQKSPGFFASRSPRRATRHFRIVSAAN